MRYSAVSMLIEVLSCVPRFIITSIDLLNPPLKPLKKLLPASKKPRRATSYDKPYRAQQVFNSGYVRYGGLILRLGGFG